nr:dynein regulatory complex protein 9 [Megalopta genalis]
MAAIETSGDVVVPQLSPQDRSTILAALEEYTNALAIYRNVLGKPPEDDNDVADCVLSDTEYVAPMAASSGGGGDCDPATDVRNYDSEPIEQLKEQAASAKLYEDSCDDLYARKIMEDLKEEIREKGTFEVLTREVEKLLGQEKAEREEEEEGPMREESERLEKLAEELRQTIGREKIANGLEEKRLPNELTARRETEKRKLIADAELDYVTAWEAARYEQNALRAAMEIEKLEKLLNECRVREENEERVRNERTKFLIRDTEAFEKKTKEWEERYVREKETYEKEIRQLRIEISTREKELKELEEEYRHKQEFIDTCLAEKEALRREKERKEHEQRSAIRIEAWWRGVMVRRKLGPYRPEEKKKKRPKTKK